VLTYGPKLKLALERSNFLGKIFNIVQHGDKSMFIRLKKVVKQLC